MSHHNFKVLSSSHGEGDPGAPDGWRVTSGTPEARTVTHYTSEDRTMLAGYWKCSAGAFHVTYTDWEYCHMLSGSCTITPEGGEPHALKAGDIFILEPGFVGTWEIHQDMSKHFVFKLSEPLSD